MRTRTSLLRIAFCGLFVALLTVSAKLTIPMSPVPFTLQTAVVLLAGVCLGWRGCLCSVGAYIVLGLLGVPVFAMGGGIQYALMPTFGFTVGFLVGSVVTSLCLRCENPSPKRLILATLAGTATIYLIGILWYLLLQLFWFGNSVDLWKILLSFWILFIPSDILKGALVVLVGGRLRRFLQRNGVMF